MNETDAKREHTAECHERGCTNGSHPAPRPGHRTGGPWTPEQVLTAAEPTGDLREQIAAAICPGIYCEAHGECLDDADAVLALPELRDALAAQEKLRSYANDPPPTSEQLRDLIIRNRELEATVRRVGELAEELQGTAEITSGKVNGFVFAALLRDLLGIGEEA